MFLLFFDVSGGEILVIVLAVFILFGPKKIPELARTIGKGVYDLKKAANEIRREINIEAGKLKNDVGLKNDIFDKEFNDTNPTENNTGTSDKKQPPAG